MKSPVLRFVSAYALLFGAAGVAFGQSLPSTSEVVVIEPLNTRVVTTFVPGVGMQTTYLVNPVECQTQPGDCYQFGVVPVTYGGGPASPTVQEVAHTQNPIDGSIFLSILPVLSTDPQSLPTLLTQMPSGNWNGTASGRVMIDRTADASTSAPHVDGALVEIPSDFVLSNSLLGSPLVPLPGPGTGAVAGFLRAVHAPASGDEASGFFSLVQRNLVGNQALAASQELAPTPVLFLRQRAAATDEEVILVEPLNTEHIGFGSRTIQGVPNGMREVMLVQPIRMLADDCGKIVLNQPELSGEIIDCFEFAAMYARYDSDGRQLLHLPNPDPSDPIQRPIDGRLEVRLIPVNSETSGTNLGLPFGEWDADAPDDPRPTNVDQVHIYTMRNGNIDIERMYETATIRVPASKIAMLDPVSANLSGGVLSFIQVSHIFGAQAEEGFYFPYKRNAIFNFDAADPLDVTPTPVFFQTDAIDRDDREVIFVEPLHQTFQGAPVIGGVQVPVVESVVDSGSGAEVYEFAIGYVTYPPDAPWNPQMHQIGGNPALAGTLEVVIANAAGVPTAASASWNGSASGHVWADLEPGHEVVTRRYEVAKIQIPKSAVVDATVPIPGIPGTLGTILGQHTEDGETAVGLFNYGKRAVGHTQTLGNAADSAPMPVVFR